MPEMSIQQANFYERMREKKQEEEDKQKSEARFAQTLNATVKAYADTLPEGEGNQLKAQNAKWGHEERQGYLNSLSLAQAYAKQQDAKLRTKQAEDTMEFYRNLPRQVGSRLTESALQRGLAGWRETLGEWSQPNATTPTPTDVRQLTSRYPGAGLDPVISRTVMGGMSGEDVSSPPQVDTVELPFGNKGAILRGSKDLKTFTNPDNRTDRTEMTDYQKAQLVNQARERYIGAKRQHDTLGSMKDDAFAQSLLPGAKEAMAAAVDELKGYGVEMPAATPEAAKYQSAEDVRAAFKAGKLDRASAKKILTEQFDLK